MLVHSPLKYDKQRINTIECINKPKFKQSKAVHVVHMYEVMWFCPITLALLLESFKLADISDIPKELKFYACLQLPIDRLTSSDSSLLVSSSSSDFCKIENHLIK